MNELTTWERDLLQFVRGTIELEETVVHVAKIDFGDVLFTGGSITMLFSVN